MTHHDILPPEQEAVLPHLKPTGVLGFVLYDGTATTLQTGLRKSVVFGFFSDRQLDEGRLKQYMPLLLS